MCFSKSYLYKKIKLYYKSTFCNYKITDCGDFMLEITHKVIEKQKFNVTAVKNTIGLCFLIYVIV